MDFLFLQRPMKIQVLRSKFRSDFDFCNEMLRNKDLLREGGVVS